MAAILITFAKQDDRAASDVAAWLSEQGHYAVFVASGVAEKTGIGSDWERELHAKLRECSAVIFLCSKDSMVCSRCIAEVVQARSIGKPLLAVKVSECEMLPLLTEVEVADLTGERQEAYGRLARSLSKLGLNSAVEWDRTRPPFPGLTAYQERDAAVFFGRDSEIHRALELLDALRRGIGGERLALFIGPSGSGKSSLVRAGLVPRLKRDTERWLVVEPFRPLLDPLSELAIALSSTFARYGSMRDRNAICDGLCALQEASAPDADALMEICQDLRAVAGARRATVLLVIDQFEELLGQSSGEPASHFLHLLRRALRATDSQLMAVATLRSDFLGNFERAALGEFEYRPVVVGPLPARSLVQVIEGPAAVAGIALEPGLVQTMIADTQTGDALPLLAFLLRQLWDHCGNAMRAGLAEYEALGGLHGSAARKADDLVSSILAPSREDLRTAFLSMVYVDQEGRYARRAMRWQDVPVKSHQLVEQFVQARLLLSRVENQQRILEIAIESLIYAWPLLRTWLEEERENLRERDRLRQAAWEWDGSGRNAEFLIHRGGRLDAALALAYRPGFTLDDLSLVYIQACERVRETQEPTRRLDQRPRPTRIFICYRRDDSIDATGRIYDRLQAHFGKADLFLDVDAIPPGVDFRKYINTVLSECRVMLTVIGDRWLDADFSEGDKAGQRRLDDPVDFVRVEIETAISRRLPIVPILVGKASMPSERDLPHALRELALLNAAEVRPGRDFHSHVTHLVQRLDQMSGSTRFTRRLVSLFRK